jgi:uncharacterized protein with PQ loop repeat
VLVATGVHQVGIGAGIAGIAAWGPQTLFTWRAKRGEDQSWAGVVTQWICVGCFLAFGARTDQGVITWTQTAGIVCLTVLIWGKWRADKLVWREVIRRRLVWLAVFAAVVAVLLALLAPGGLVGWEGGLIGLYSWLAQGKKTLGTMSADGLKWPWLGFSLLSVSAWTWYGLVLGVLLLKVTITPIVPVVLLLMWVKVFGTPREAAGGAGGEVAAVVVPRIPPV